MNTSITDETADTTICTVKSSAHMKNSFDDANRFNIPCTGVTGRTGGCVLKFPFCAPQMQGEPSSGSFLPQFVQYITKPPFKYV